MTSSPGRVKPFSDEVAEMIMAEAEPAPRMAATNAAMKTSFRRIWSVSFGRPACGKQDLFLSGLEYHSLDATFVRRR